MAVYPITGKPAGRADIHYEQMNSLNHSAYKKADIAGRLPIHTTSIILCYDACYFVKRLAYISADIRA